MRSWKRYQKYKDSGVEWLGEIPKGWRIIPLNRLLEVFWDYRGRTPKKLGMDWSEVGIPAISANNVHNGKIDLIETNYASTELFQKWMTNGVTREGDVVMTSEAPLGEVAQIPDDKKYLLSQRVVLMRTNSLILINSYLFHYIASKNFKFFLSSESTGSTAIGIKMSKFQSSNILIPPLPEQTAIASFLDRETTRIDALIEKKQRQIELLQEKRAALISQAVTKGLDPKVPMKDSGVPWLGEVPKSWTVLTLKRVADIIDADRGVEYPNQDDFVNSGIPFLSTKNIQNNQLTYKNAQYITIEKLNRLREGRLKNEDIIISVRGSRWLSAIFFDNIFPTAFINAQLMIIRPNRQKITSKFIHYYLICQILQDYLERTAYGSAQKQLSNGIISTIPFLLPPIPEQNKITAYLDQENIKNEATIEKIFESIQYLQEYRSALISAAVTGKIDVREEALA